MGNPKIGELLRRHVPLTTHDIDEILHEQSHTRRRFGDVAMALGLCSPQDVWAAWCEQIKDSIEHVNLDDIGIDAQATKLLPPAVARACGAVAVRCTDTHLVVATSDVGFERTAAELPHHVSRRLRFVIAPPEQVERAVRAYYRETRSSPV